MKKIDFGYNNDTILNSTFEGIYPYSGEYIDLINCCNMDLLVTKIVDSYEGKYDGKIEVREIVQDLYPDGSYNSYTTQNQPALCGQIETILNRESVKQKLDEGAKISKILSDLGMPSIPSSLKPIHNDKYEIAGTLAAINPEMFNDLKTTLANGHSSIYNMLKELKELRAKVSYQESQNPRR